MDGIQDGRKTTKTGQLFELVVFQLFWSMFHPQTLGDMIRFDEDVSILDSRYQNIPSVNISYIGPRMVLAAYSDGKEALFPKGGAQGPLNPVDPLAP